MPSDLSNLRRYTSVSDSDRPRPVFLYAIVCAFCGLVFLRLACYALAATAIGLLPDDGSRSPSLAGVIFALGQRDPALFIPACVVLTLLVLTSSTSSWKVTNRTTALTLALLFALLAGVVGANWSYTPRRPWNTPPPGLAVTGPGTDLADSRTAVQYLPLHARRQGDDLVLSPDLVGGLPGRYRLRAQVMVAATSLALARRVRDVELPRDVGQLGESFAWSELVAGWRRGPRAGEPVRLHLELSLTPLEAGRPDAPGAPQAHSAPPTVYRASGEFGPVPAR